MNTRLTFEHPIQWIDETIDCDLIVFERGNPLSKRESRFTLLYDEMCRILRHAPGIRQESVDGFAEKISSGELGRFLFVDVTNRILHAAF
jgi:hypothetical protein